MAKPYKKTAKDLAFEAERNKLYGEIRRWKELLREKDKELEKLKMDYAILQEENEANKESINYLAHGAYTPEELAKYISAMKTFSNFLKLF